MCHGYQVCAMRLPVEVLQAHMAAMLEGLLLWSEDSKNKFRLKVRVLAFRALICSRAHASQVVS